MEEGKKGLDMEERAWKIEKRRLEWVMDREIRRIWEWGGIERCCEGVKCVCDEREKQR